jgi:hypothetical protein
MTPVETGCDTFTGVMLPVELGCHSSRGNTARTVRSGHCPRAFVPLKAPSEARDSEVCYILPGFLPFNAIREARPSYQDFMLPRFHVGHQTI